MPEMVVQKSPWPILFETVVPKRQINCTKYQNSHCRPKKLQKLNNQFFWLLRPRGVLENQSLFPSLPNGSSGCRSSAARPRINITCMIIRLRNSDGWSGFWGRLFRTKSVMGRLWDDHFRHLGHPPKFYRFQDAGFIDGSSIWWQFRLILKTNHWKIIKQMFLFED